MSHSPSNSSAERQRRRRPARRGRSSLAASMATTNDEITALLEPHRHSPSPLTENDAFNISTHSASSLSSGMNYNATGTTSLRSNNSFANLTASLTASWISNSRRTSQDRPSKPRPPQSVDLYSTTLKACTENICELFIYIISSFNSSRLYTQTIKLHHCLHLSYFILCSWTVCY